MRILTLLFILMLSFGFITESGEQTCIDQSLINPNANCLFVYEPVCGCDGNSYANECIAVSNGISQMQQGPCGCNYNWNNLPPCFSCFSRVEIIEYDHNTYIAEWGNNLNCSDALTTLYNCDGSVFCTQGGITGANTCGNLDDNYTTLNVLWSEDAFCNCNYQSWYEVPDCNTCVSRVERIAYNGNTYIAFWDDGTNCSDGLSTIYNCNGSVHCEIGGIAGINTCGFLPYNYTVIETLWDNQTDCNVVDLALRMTLQSGQPSSFNQGDLVTFDITVFNQGSSDAAIIDIVNYIPQGLLLNDGDWNIVSTSTPNTAIAQIIGPIPPQGQETISITLYVEDDSFCSIVNAAEILVIDDIDSISDTFNNNDITIDNEINNTNSDEDDHDIELIGINCQNCPSLLDLGTNNLNSGTYQAGVELRSDGTVTSGSNVKFKADSIVSMQNGFTVESGADFSAKIGACSCNVPAPNNLYVSDVGTSNIYLSWDGVPEVNWYYIEYVVGGVTTYHHTPDPYINIEFEPGTDHQYTVFTTCGETDSQGPTVNFTNSLDCLNCDPVENIVIAFNDDGDLVITWDGADSVDLVLINLYDENGNPLSGETIEVSPGEDPIEIPSGLFDEEEIIEVGISVTCNSNTQPGFRSNNIGCHEQKVIIIAADDEPWRYGDYCGIPDVRPFKILCQHTGTCATIAEFQCMHCNDSGIQVNFYDIINCRVNCSCRD